ncbi:MAG: FMN-binding protein [Treponema sp.]|jgi:fumarate reductase flavoprotein subunit|nr:FMN-binding protein [Treponema sp.]
MRVFHVPRTGPHAHSPIPALISTAILSLTLGLALILALGYPLLTAGCAGREYRTGPGLYRDGLWEGSGRGYGGQIRVQLRIASGLIQEIRIIAHNEDTFSGGEAMEELLEQVLDYQSTDLDAVSGATQSGTGFLAAVQDALDRAAGP